MNSPVYWKVKIKLAQGNNILIGDEKNSLVSRLNEVIRSTQNNNNNSEYYDINELNSIDSKCHNEMNIFHLNISSLQSFTKIMAQTAKFARK